MRAALSLGEPLLLTGEPGTGKTALAYWLARQLGTGILHFQVQSTSQARDVRYRYDELRRFREAWRARSGAPGDPIPAEDPMDYLEPGPLWRAITDARATGRPQVLLLDEIDKAPRDFPNDLLHDLDQVRFAVPELGPEAEIALDPKTEADLRPVVIVTSNLERELPGPFLRRCCYCQLRFTPELVLAALQARREELGQPSDAFLELAVQRFMDVRRAVRRKPPATSEAIMWVRALCRFGVREADLARTDLEVRFRHLLVKTPEDWKDAFGEALRSDGSSEAPPRG